MIKTASGLSSTLVSCLFLILLFMLHLYKSENRYFIKFLCYFQSKPTPAVLKKNTMNTDIFIFAIVIIIVLISGLNLVSFVVVVSDSMVPEFKRGDVILTQSISLEPNPGDIISFTAMNRNLDVTHRIIQVKGGRIITKGDNNPWNDRYKTYQENVLRKAIMVNDHPIVIKKVGALFIADYTAEGKIYKYGDKFTFLKQLSASIRSWGYLITILALFGYLLSMKK